MESEGFVDPTKIDYVPKMLEELAGEKNHSQNFHDEINAQWKKLPMAKLKRGDLRYGKMCNTCKFRPKEDGGTGVCRAYEEDALCVITEQTFDMIKNTNFSDPNQLVQILECVLAMVIDRFMSFVFKENLSGEDDDKRINKQAILIIKLSDQIFKMTGKVEGTMNKNSPAMMGLEIAGKLRSRVENGYNGS